MRFPWSKRETRNYTDAIVEHLTSYAAGQTTRSSPAVVEIALGLWGRALASATVSPETPALTPAILEQMGRALLLRGEAVYRIDVDQGIRLLPSASWSVKGGTDEREWTYKVTEHTPDGHEITRTLPADGVVHLRIGAEPGSPWKGCGPLQNSSTSKTLAGRIETRLSEEADAKTGTLLAVPEVKQQLQDDINRLKGEVVLVRGPSNWDAPGRPGGTELRPQRLGFSPPEHIEGLRDSVSRSVLAAAGVPAALLGSDGVASREGNRQLILNTILPVSKIISVELADKLDVPGLTMTFEALQADITNRARGVGTLVKAGVQLDEAMRHAGFA